MGVIQNIYCIPNSPGAAPWEDVLGALLEAGCITGKLWAGSPFDADRQGGSLRPPTTPMFDESEMKSLTGFHDPGAAAKAIANLVDATVSVFVEAQTYRVHPEHFYPGGADFGLYRFREGHRLVVGEPEDFSDIAKDDPGLYESMKPASLDPIWEGTVHEMLWLHGKNAPLREDFLGSPFHRIIERFWPEHLVVEDCWL